MPLLDHVLQLPSYGWKDETGSLIKPSVAQIFSEFFSRLNVFKTRKKWLLFFSWLKVSIHYAFFIFYLVIFLSWWNILTAFLYGITTTVMALFVYYRYQIDFAWCHIELMSHTGAICHYRNYKERFYNYYYLPHLKRVII